MLPRSYSEVCLTPSAARRRGPWARFSALGILLLLGSGCSVVGSDYPEANADAVQAFRAGRFKAAARDFGSRKGALESDEFLSLVEQGMVWHVSGNLARASKTWLQASKVLEDFRDRPTVSGRGIAEGVLSMVVNDKALPYDGEGFEVALLHGFLAWDYLLRGRLDDAWVEIQYAYDIQNDEEKRYGSTYGMNRFARFMAALVQELDGKFGEAQKDLHRLAREMPGNHAVAYSLERVKKLQGRDRTAEWGRAQLILVFERGMMPPKRAQELAYGTRHSIGRISVPAFGSARPEMQGLELLLDGKAAGRTELLEAISQVARKNLDDRIAWLTTKTVARSAVKTVVLERAAREVSKKHGEGAGILVGVLGSILNMTTERADLRSWLTLPSSIQVLRVPVPPGEHEIALSPAGGAAGGGPRSLGTFSFQPGKPVLVRARSLGARLFAQAYPWGAPPEKRKKQAPAAPQTAQTP